MTFVVQPPGASEVVSVRSDLHACSEAHECTLAPAPGTQTWWQCSSYTHDDHEYNCMLVVSQPVLTLALSLSCRLLHSTSKRYCAIACVDVLATMTLV